MPNLRIAPLLALSLFALPLLPGCGSDGGRIPVSQTTAAERESARILPVGLTEFSDQASRRLVEDLARVVEDAPGTPGKATIILGDINNQTGIVSSGDFEMMTRRLRSNLINSSIARDRLRFVEYRARMGRIAERERVAQDGYVAQAPDYDPATTYVLNGDFFRVGRGNTSQYYLETTLSHFGSNEIVWSDRYDLKQVEGD